MTTPTYALPAQAPGMPAADVTATNAATFALPGNGDVTEATGGGGGGGGTTTILQVQFLT